MPPNEFSQKLLLVTLTTSKSMESLSKRPFLQYDKYAPQLLSLISFLKATYFLNSLVDTSAFPALAQANL
jgi:hypothetical protein